MISQYVRQTDHVGTLGGDGFGFIFTLSDFAQTQAKMETITSRLDTVPLIWEATQVRLDPIFAISEMQEKDTV